MCAVCVYVLVRGSVCAPAAVCMYKCWHANYVKNLFVMCIICLFLLQVRLKAISDHKKKKNSYHLLNSIKKSSKNWETNQLRRNQAEDEFIR